MELMLNDLKLNFQMDEALLCGGFLSCIVHVYVCHFNDSTKKKRSRCFSFFFFCTKFSSS